MGTEIDYKVIKSYYFRSAAYSPMSYVQFVAPSALHLLNRNQVIGGLISRSGLNL